VRIFALARELGMESKALLTLCQQNGIDVKNQLSTLEPELRDVVVDLVRKDKTASPGVPTLAATPGTLPEVPGRVRTLSAARSPRSAVRPETGEPDRPEVAAGSTPVSEPSPAPPASPAA